MNKRDIIHTTAEKSGRAGQINFHKENSDEVR